MQEFYADFHIHVGMSDMGKWIQEIADYKRPRHPDYRAPYFCQIPLAFIPGIGKKSLEKLLQYFGTEMNVVHNTPAEDLLKLVGKKVSESIIKARKGDLAIIAVVDIRKNTKK